MGAIADLWDETRGRPLQGLKCAMRGCTKVPSSQCPECNNYYCDEHINTHSNHFSATNMKK